MVRIYNCAVDTELLTGMRLAKLAIAREQLVVLPTDTVYGLAANAFSHKAVANLLATKGRDETSPPPVLIPNLNTLDALADQIPQIARDLATKFWPGALTMILRAQPSLDWNLGETRGTVALRMPDHKVALALLEETGPLAVSSANLTGKPAATNAAAAFDYLGNQVEVYLDAGVAAGGKASTILDLTAVVEKLVDGNLVVEGKIRVVRLGALSLAKLRKVAGDLLEAS
jgi:tRNA threonylcarbamoyl adenosine modification protein (Sua5/YciO/YrdC/YwlC family)